MPNYRTHLVGGAVTYASVCCLFVFAHTQFSLTFPQFLLGFYLSLLGSIFPDIDIKSKMQQMFLLFISPIFLTGIIYQQWILLSILSTCVIFITFIKHRSLTHNIWFIISIPLVVVLPILASTNIKQHVVMMMYLFFVFGALSHRFLDYGPRRFFSR